MGEIAYPEQLYLTLCSKDRSRTKSAQSSGGVTFLTIVTRRKIAGPYRVLEIDTVSELHQSKKHQKPDVFVDFNLEACCTF